MKNNVGYQAQVKEWDDSISNVLVCKTEDKAYIFYDRNDVDKKTQESTKAKYIVHTVTPVYLAAHIQEETLQECNEDVQAMMMATLS